MSSTGRGITSCKRGTRSCITTNKPTKALLMAVVWLYKSHDICLTKAFQRARSTNYNCQSKNWEWSTSCNRRQISKKKKTYQVFVIEMIEVNLCWQEHFLILEILRFMKQKLSTCWLQFRGQLIWVFKMTSFKLTANNCMMACTLHPFPILNLVLF